MDQSTLPPDIKMRHSQLDGQGGILQERRVDDFLQFVSQGFQWRRRGRVIANRLDRTGLEGAFGAVAPPIAFNAIDWTEENHLITVRLAGTLSSLDLQHPLETASLLRTEVWIRDALGQYLLDDINVVIKRTLTRAELMLLHREARLFLSGLKCRQLDLDDPEWPSKWAAYRTLYSHCVFQSPNRQTADNLGSPDIGMPWMAKAFETAAGDGFPYRMGTVPNRLQGYVLGDEIDYNASDRDVSIVIRRQQDAIRRYRDRGPDPQSNPNAIYVIISHPIDVNSLEQIALTATLNPDVLSTDFYPFRRTAGAAQFNLQSYCESLEMIRAAGQTCNKPYWLFTQAHRNSHDAIEVRFPTLAENRLQYFAPLTFGFTGFIDWYYDETDNSHGRNENAMLTDAAGFPRLDEPGDPVGHGYYPRHRTLLEWVANVGRMLARLRNTRIQYGERMLTNAFGASSTYVFSVDDDGAFTASAMNDFLGTLGLRDLRDSLGIEDSLPPVGITSLGLRSDARRVDRQLIVGRFQEPGDDVEYPGAYFMVTNGGTDPDLAHDSLGAELYISLSGALENQLRLEYLRPSIGTNFEELSLVRDAHSQELRLPAGVPIAGGVGVLFRISARV